MSLCTPICVTTYSNNSGGASSVGAWRYTTNTPNIGPVLSPNAPYLDWVQFKYDPPAPPKYPQTPDPAPPVTPPVTPPVGCVVQCGFVDVPPASSVDVAGTLALLVAGLIMGVRYARH